MGVVFRRIGGRVVPITTAALKSAGMNFPSVRKELAHAIVKARKNKVFPLAQVRFGNKTVFAQIPRRGVPTTVTAQKRTGRGSKSVGSILTSHFMKLDGVLGRVMSKVGGK